MPGLGHGDEDLPLWWGQVKYRTKKMAEGEYKRSWVIFVKGSCRCKAEDAILEVFKKKTKETEIISKEMYDCEEGNPGPYLVDISKLELSNRESRCCA